MPERALSFGPAPSRSGSYWCNALEDALKAAISTPACLVGSDAHVQHNRVGALENGICLTDGVHVDGYASYKVRAAG